MYTRVDRQLLLNIILASAIDFYNGMSATISAPKKCPPKSFELEFESFFLKRVLGDKININLNTHIVIPPYYNLFFHNALKARYDFLFFTIVRMWYGDLTNL